MHLTLLMTFKVVSGAFLLSLRELDVSVNYRSKHAAKNRNVSFSPPFIWELP
jgi:hypothetical protein